jgi:hypothetical protein
MPAPVTDTGRTCSKCRTFKLFSEYPRDKTNPYGVTSQCKACRYPVGQIGAKLWRENNPEKSKATSAAYRVGRRAEFREKHAAWVAANIDHKRAYVRAYKKKNRPVFTADTARRRVKRARATPTWANEFFIKEAYRLAALRTQITGFRWEVDHLVPIRSKLVCGLHVEHNLAVIPESQNRSKSNRIWPDMF